MFFSHCRLFVLGLFINTFCLIGSADFPYVLYAIPFDTQLNKSQKELFHIFLSAAGAGAIKYYDNMVYADLPSQKYSGGIKYLKTQALTLGYLCDVEKVVKK